MNQSKISIRQRIREWFLDLFFEEYEIVVWFHKESQINEHGLKSVSYTEPKTYYMSRLDKITHTHIKGKDINGNPLEIKTTQPFNYNVKKLR